MKYVCGVCEKTVLASLGCPDDREAEVYGIEYVCKDDQTHRFGSEPKFGICTTCGGKCRERKVLAVRGAIQI